MNSFGFKVQKYLSLIYVEQTFFIPPAPQLKELILGCLIISLDIFFECPSDSQDQSCQPINEPQNFQTHMIGLQEWSGPYQDAIYCDYGGKMVKKGDLYTYFKSTSRLLKYGIIKG